MKEQIDWNGEGLPPVGTVCEYQNSLGSWLPVEITAIAKKGICFVQPERDGENYVCQVSAKFRPIRTPEQIAADKRLHEIRNALTAIKAGQQQFPNDLVRGNIVAATVEAMIDAGYRKFEIVDRGEQP